MSAAFAEPVLDRPSVEVQEGCPSPASARRAPARTAPARTRPRRTGPGVGPSARPRRLRFTAPAVSGTGSGPRACEPLPAVSASSAARSWHLTERGLAVVLVIAAALVAASIAVVGLTALRVTSESYQPGHSAIVPVVVEP